MRKLTLTISLLLTLAISGSAGGVIPISGFAGCENGLYYPETGECVVNLAASPSIEKLNPVFSDTSLIGAILHFRDMIF
jgi:hypothetical protein